MHPKRKGVAIATLTLTHIPANGVHEPGTRKPSPCPEASGGTTYLPERVANARFIAGAHDSMPVALRLIRAALRAGTADPGAAMQDALDEVFGEQAAAQAPVKPAARKHRAAARRASPRRETRSTPEFAPCGDCGFVHNESFCPRCEGDGEEDLAPPGSANFFAGPAAQKTKG
jgi:hypothetical protein